MPTPEAKTRRQQLRAATQAEHAQLDALFPDGLTDADSYRRYLQGMHRLCADIGSRWKQVPVSALRDDVRQRVRLLEADLAHLGHAPLPPGPPLQLHGELELAGAEYVMQGSRHGALLLIRQVQALGHGPDTGAAFLHWLTRPQGKQAWEALLEDIAHKLQGDADESSLMAAAIRTFAAASFAFERARHARTSP